MNYLLPNIGELNFTQKAYFIGYMVNRLLKLYTKEEETTDRDSFRFKRVDLTGTLIYDLFKEYYTLQQNDIFLQLDKEYFYSVKKNANSYQNLDFMNLIAENQSKIFSNRIVENGFQKAFKGDWGAESHTKKIGALQDLNRLSFFGTMAQMRKANIPVGSDGAKIVGPRHINSTQWGIFCPIHSPDGGNVGLHKHFSILTHITKKQSGHPFIEYFRSNDFGMSLLEECSPKFISDNTKVFINGAWIGVTATPQEFKSVFILYRRNGLFNILTSIYWNIALNEIHVQTDAGRACHPLVHVTNGELSYEKDEMLERIESKTITWKECVLGTGKHIVDIDIDNDNTKELVVVGEWMPVKIFKFLQNKLVDITDSLGLSKTNGLYNNMHSEDLDGDGYTDLVLGNYGLNSMFRASIEQPLSLYVNDFDNNGRTEQILAMHYDEKLYPIVQLKDLWMQIPSLKKKYLKFENYKNVTMDKLFDPSTIRDSEVKKVYNLSSVSLYNKKGKGFEIKELPFMAQLSPIFSIISDDINNDGVMDLILGGNLSRVKPEFGPNSSSYSTLLLGTKDKRFKYVNSKLSGLFISGEIRDLDKIKINKKDSYIFAVNNSKLKILENE